MEEMNRTHKGLLFGIVPVYLDMTNEQEPIVEVRWSWLDPIADICAEIFGLCVAFRQFVDPDYEPMFPIRVTGEIKKRS